MHLPPKLALVTLATVSTAPTTTAADILSVPTSTPFEMPIHETSPFDWSGFYVGVYGGLTNSVSTGLEYGLGAQAGINAQFDFYLVGAEVSVQGLAGDVGNTTYGQILGRAGLVVGDDVLIYAAGGYGIDLGPPVKSDIALGGGVELAVTDSITIEAEYLHRFGATGTLPSDQVRLGANFHF